MYVSNSRSGSAASSINSAAAKISAAPVNTGASRTVAIATNEDNIAFVSLLPGSFPNGVSAVISNLRSGASVSAPMIDGGLDPIPLPAITGDSIRIQVQTAGGMSPQSLMNFVRGSQPPKIVRTIPGRGRTGVPLNQTIQVVFSEPVAASSLSSSSIELFQGDTRIASSVQILQGVTASVVISPTAALDPNTDYKLVVTSAVRDLDGDALDSTVTIPFTTGTTTVGPLATLGLIPDNADVRVGDQFQLIVTAKDAQGVTLTGHPVTWWMTDTTVARVTTAGLVTARGEGTAPILAEVDGYFVAMLVHVSNAIGPVASVTVAVDSASVAADGTMAIAAIARDAEGNLLERRVARWSTSNSAVATVAPSTNDQATDTDINRSWFNGLPVAPSALYRAEVTGVANGVARIVATIEGRSDTVVVTVAASPPIVGFVLSADTATLLLRQTAQLSGLSVNSAGGRTSVTSAEVKWESSNPDVASVDAAGAVTGAQAGSATISGRWSTFSASVRVTVVQMGFESMSAGRFHTCALAAGGATYCWGANDFGQAGRPGLIGAFPNAPATVFYPTPMRVAEGLTFVAVTAGGFHTCGLTAGGAAYCWGYNGYGALGSSDFADSWHPVPVTGGLTFVKIEAGTNHTCALTSAGAAYCWGLNRSGQLGSSGPISSPKPLAVVGGLSFASLSVGGSHSCGVTTDGGAYCWGENGGGQLGVGENVTSSSSPLPVSGGLTFASVSAGESHTCGITQSGSLYCWGWNFESQLGNGNPYTPSAVPVAVASSLTFKAIGAGSSHTCAIDTNGTGYCWGQNLDGQVGLGTVTGELFATPQAVVGGLAFDKLSVGRSHTCAATAAGVWYCWGANESGFLGVGTTTDSGTPLKVLGQP
jgi:alpha-tubulin suppressor-like RCC1 family protein